MAFTPEAGQVLVSGGQDDLDMLAISVVNSSPAISRVTTWPQTGAACVAHDMTTNGNKAISPLAASARWSTAGIIPLSLALAVSADPTSAAGVVYHNTAAGAPATGGKVYVKIETDRRLGIYTKNGALLGKSVTQVPSGASGTPQEFTVIWDGLSLPSVFVIIFAGDAVDATFDTGLAWADVFDSSIRQTWLGEYLDTGVNRGCIVFIDDGMLPKSTTASDAPHLAAYPRVRVSEPVNTTTVGNYNAWDSDDGAGGIDSATSDPTYIDNGELPTHDGDSSYLQSTTDGEAFTMKSTDANPIPVGATIISVEQRMVARLTGAGKLPASFRHRLSATDADVAPGAIWSNYSTSYVGTGHHNIAKPGGGSWAQSDFASSTLEWGCVNLTLSGSRITLMLGPSVAYHTDTLPLSRTPTSDASIKLFGRKIIPFPVERVAPPAPTTFMGIFTVAAATSPLSAALFGKPWNMQMNVPPNQIPRPWRGVLVTSAVAPRRRFGQVA